jgi:ribosomal-protein-alanine N-acetyltransferase
VTIRRAGIADAGLIAALHAASFAQAWSAEDFARFLTNPLCRCLLASAPIPNGFVVVRVAADEAEVLTLAVAPEARRRGLAALLMRSLQEELIAAGTRRLYLEVGVVNEAAVALYEGLGFEKAGRRPGYYQTGDGAGEDAILMRRLLT